jgi:hypothetical protein
MAEQLLAVVPAIKKRHTVSSNKRKRVISKNRVFLLEPIEVVLMRIGRPASPQEIAKICEMDKAGIHRRLSEAWKEGRVHKVQEAKAGNPPKPALWEPT